MIPRPLDRAGLCVCGVPVALHFDAADRKIACDLAGLRFARQQRVGVVGPAVVLPFRARGAADAVVTPERLETETRA